MTTETPPSKQVTHAMEDYLKAIYRLSEREPNVTAHQLATELSVSGASVTNMVKRLDELNLVEYSRYKGVTLTESGRKIALEVIRHHRLLELYLSESLGMPWHEVHAEAERLEHHLSEDLEARMDSALGYPTHDPHGDPIPTAELELVADDSRWLTEVADGTEAVVSRVPDGDPELLRYLASLGIVPDQPIVLVGRAPFDGPVTIEIGGARHAIGLAVAEQIRVSGAAA